MKISASAKALGITEEMVRKGLAVYQWAAEGDTKEEWVEQVLIYALSPDPQRRWTDHKAEDRRGKK